MQLFTEKYFPKNLSEFIGNSGILESVKRWAELWNEGKKQTPLLLWGAPGVGKTCLAHLIASEFDWGLFEMNASDLRTKDVIEKVAGAAALNTSFSGKPRLVLLDEIDGLNAKDRGAAAAILAIIRDSKNPVILIANEIYSDKKLSTIRVACKTLEFKKINYLSIAKFLEEICEKEEIKYEKEAVKELAKNSSGDMRAALLDLQSLSNSEINLTEVNSLSCREREEKIFEVMKHIFQAHDFYEARNSVFSSEVSKDLLFRWVEENIPRQYSGKEVEDAFASLSKADLYNSRIYRRQNYSFLKFYCDFMSAGVALAKEEKLHGFTPYQFPKLLMMLSRSSSKRALLVSIGTKIKAKSHDSAKQIIAEDLPYIMMMMSKSHYAVSFSSFFGFDEKELGFLLDKKSNSKEVSSVLKEAADLREKMIIEKRGIIAKDKSLINSYESVDEPAEEIGPAEEDLLEKPKETEDEKSKQTTLF